MPHTLIFVDLPSPDPEASGRFYEAVFGWTVEGRPAGTFHRIVPGGEFPGPDGKDSGVGNLHLGLYSTANPVPDPNVPSTHAGQRPSRPLPRVSILDEQDEEQQAIVGRAKENAEAAHWELAWCGGLNGWCPSFPDGGGGRTLP